MLGRTLQRKFAGEEVVVADLPDWDITDSDAFLAKVVETAPDVVVHCAAMTKVDDCETHRDLAFRLNEEGSRNVAVACKACGARLIAISTDYVFSGEPPREPWAWSETDIPRPRTVYGASKFAGEQMVQMILPEAVILRINTSRIVAPSLSARPLRQATAPATRLMVGGFTGYILPFTSTNWKSAPTMALLTNFAA